MAEEISVRAQAARTRAVVLRRLGRDVSPELLRLAREAGYTEEQPPAGDRSRRSPRPSR